MKNDNSDTTTAAISSHDVKRNRQDLPTLSKEELELILNEDPELYRDSNEQIFVWNEK